MTFHYYCRAKTIEISIDGKPVLFRQGLQEIGTTLGSLSPSCVEYAAMQVAQGTYTREAKYLLPPTGKQSYDGVFVINLAPLNMKTGGLATVTTHWTDAMSPKKLFMMSLSVAQYKAIYRHQQPLKMDPVT